VHDVFLFATIVCSVLPPSYPSALEAFSKEEWGWGRGVQVLLHSSCILQSTGKFGSITVNIIIDHQHIYGNNNNIVRC
jgi:hypothetical protein